MWNAIPFFEECLPKFALITKKFSGYDDCERETRLRAYAKWGFMDLAGRDRWTNKIEHEIIDLIDEELPSDDRWEEYAEAVTAFVSYVYGALAAKRELGEITPQDLQTAHVQLATYDMINMEEIDQVYGKAFD